MFTRLRENMSPAIAAAALLRMVGTRCLAALAFYMSWRRERELKRGP